MFEVLIAGGGVAALEAALALRKHAADHVNVTLMTPSSDFVYRPMAVLEPFARAGPRTLDLAAFAAEHGMWLAREELAGVDRDRRLAHTPSGRALPYDALLVAVGAKAGETIPEAVIADPAHLAERLDPVLAEIDAGELTRLAIVIPRPAWPLPAYELALLLAARSPSVALTIVTAEPRPLGVFGKTISLAVAQLLADSGIEVVGDARVARSEDGVLVNPGQRRFPFDRVLSVPRLAGPGITGLPADAAGFIPTRVSGQVPGVERVYAAGDATTFPVKWGGFAAQQADAAAASIAGLAGVEVAPEPFDGDVHGVLIAREDRRLYFSARLGDGSARAGRVSDRPLAPAQAKLAARHLAPYLDERWAAGPRWLAGELSWEQTLRRLEAQALTG